MNVPDIAKVKMTKKREVNIMPDRERLLELALKGLEAERAKIDAEIAQIKTQFNSRPASARGRLIVATAAAPTRRRKRTMSAEARRKISEAMKRRHALRKAAAKK